MPTTPHGRRATQSLAHTTITPAGVEWDAVRVPRHIALAALELLEVAVGAVIVDPFERVLYFLVPPGAAESWELAWTRALGAATYVVLPPAGRRMPPGPYWLNPPDGPRLHTPAGALHTALRHAIDATLGPREAAS